MIHLVRAVGAMLVLGYGALMISDYHWGNHPRNQIPPSVRASPGGIGAWSFWHSGEHGGK